MPNGSAAAAAAPQAARLVDPLTAGRRLLYLVTPTETASETVAGVPRFVDESIPYFILLIVFEYAILVWRGRGDRFTVGDGIGSISGGIVSQLPLLLARSIEVSSYIWVYDNFHVVDVAWNSTWAWLLALVGVDFGYYWVHRFAHEVNLFWSGHQMHHSSERYNLTTALRQSVLQRYFSWFFYLPLALLLPPSLFVVHVQFNLIYQFWIHTEIIDRLPWPIEFVMNTPSHHRVHHGRNPYCIDKNYAGTFVIFDRLFGTFEAERREDPPVYGLLHPVQTLDPVELQLFHLRAVWRQIAEQSNWADRLRAAFWGPGWLPGTGRLGDHSTLPEVQHPVRQFDLSCSPPAWVTAYACAHFLATVGAYGFLAVNRSHLPTWSILIGCCLVVLTLSSVARLVEKFDAAAVRKELARCAVLCSLCVLLHSARPPSIGTAAVQLLYIASSGLWLYRGLRLRAGAAGGRKKDN